MEKYQIVEIREGTSTAWGKAPADAAVIAKRCGYRSLPVRRVGNDAILGKCRKRIGFFLDWCRAMHKLPDNALLLLQFPFHDRYYLYGMHLRNAKKRGIRLIYLVHDVEQIRESFDSDSHRRELEFMLCNADAVIVHNEAMKRWFIETLNVDSSKLVPLQLFDYLCSWPEIIETEIQLEANTEGNTAGAADITITHQERKLVLYIAGNLDAEKTEYLKSLPKLKDIQFILYGINCPEELKQASNVKYQGVADPDEMPVLLQKLNRKYRGFGLVWDGSSLETCSGSYGNYLKYNAPHKLSLYLAAGIPVVIWNQAAEAAFIREKGAGVAIESISDISKEIRAQISEDRYQNLEKGSRAIAEKLRKGSYLRKALNKAEKIATGGRNCHAEGRTSERSGSGL